MKKSTPDSEKSNSKYWLSLEQWGQDPEFKKMAENEFLSSPMSELDGDQSVQRRSFLKLMGASMALSSFGCVRRPAQKIVPYADRPKDIIPGEANYYASSFIDGFEGFGTVVTTREGRPIKVEGNTLHSSNRGGMSARAHAHVLSLYDPDRISGPKRNLLNETKTNRDTVGVTWAKADKEIKKALGNGGVALLTGDTSSPSTRKLLKEFQGQFSASHFIWEPIVHDYIRKGQKLSYGQDVLPEYRFDRADLIVSIDADFLSTFMQATSASRDFSLGRKKPAEKMNRLVAFESLLSLTGSNADERHRIKASQQLDVVMALVYEIIVKMQVSSFAVNSELKSVLSAYSGVSAKLGIDGKVFSELAKELWDYRGRGLVIAGGLPTQTDRAVDLQIATNLLNSLLENDGKTVDYKNSYSNGRASTQDLLSLIESANRGEIKTLIIHGTNPIYGAGNDFKFAEAMAKIETVIYTGDRVDETGQVANFVLPDHHALENWGDLELGHGRLSIQQPTIRPLNETRAFQEGLLSWMGKDISWYDYLRANWQKNIFSGGDFEGFWVRLLQMGVWDSKADQRSETNAGRSFSNSSFSRLAPKQRSSGYELVLYSTSGLRDGTLANVSWLQEFPDPVTKICWDNYATMSPKMARKEGLHIGDIIELKVGDGRVEVPVHIQPGQHDEVIGLALGYGRWAAGKVADGVGVRTNNLATAQGGELIYSGRPATVKSLGRKMELANVQGHHSMESRQIVVEATLDQYKENPASNIHKHKIFSLWAKHEYKGRKWAMSVDLNTCTGCSACIIACQSENNIPVVGKKNCLNGREMHWMRIDRYYVGDPESPDSVHMPVMCQHCDNAPCETVCPVAATTHSEEGINDMTYNRCVGTRYCANNCPYKVRRFNWFGYTGVKSPLHMAMNPEVTVRDRGVMEKCSFCNHRIKEASYHAKNKGLSYKDGDIKTACEQSCPTQAITFGDMNDKSSRVSVAHAEKNTYSLLEELNNVPAVRYRTKIRNTKELKGHSGHDGGGHH